MMQTYYTEHIELILIFGIIGFFAHRFASQKNFYNLPDVSTKSQTKLSFIHVVLGFFLYIAGSLGLPIILTPLLSSLFPAKNTAISWGYLFSMVSVFLLLCGFYLTILRRDFLKIWKNSLDSSFTKDALLGFITWFLAFPIVAIVEQLSDLFVYSLFGLKEYEQVAVLYLKTALNNPLQLLAALLLILVTAPLLEELLFRGLLQSWIKKHLGAKAAILLTSLGFALFHISATHGAGNVSLVLSLFTFSCFLGFIYERQQSLLSSVTLHSTFNTVTAIRILFFMDG
ncbi:MAG: CPBP family intramembrane metalloprotease [Rhabdochlamydiaceae bacterium]|nr:CPBP family intramembrane metalloprotease [Rhabdochlamydiaceae bacterium]